MGMGPWELGIAPSGATRVRSHGNTSSCRGAGTWRSGPEPARRYALEGLRKALLAAGVDADTGEDEPEPGVRMGRA